MKKENQIVGNDVSVNPLENIENLILNIRGKQVMLDRDLARLYGVETRILNQAVKRNIERFPEDFMFQLSHEEFESNLRSAWRLALYAIRIYRMRNFYVKFRSSFSNRYPC